ncbi:hypothetical protein FOZ61_004313 [Perkinsus olseni]|uniref:Uncharacterized protein n=1 Tax=Perkinsus olseni TaxID=32597 RepID=A0A7J6LL55_PEROL|nr:hypothetical protein FOZ61_004313 [Perkinsus olseni]
MPKGIEAVISSNKAKGFKLARLCGMFKAKRDETSTEDLLKRLACTKQRVQELQEWKVAFLAEWNLELPIRMARNASTSCSPSESSATYCLVDDPWKDI